MSQLVTYDPAAGKGADLRTTAGDWTLHLSLPYGANGQPVPAPGQLGGVTVTFTAVAAYSAGVHVSFVTSGATADQLLELPSLPPICLPAGTAQPSSRIGPVRVTCVGGTPGPTPFQYQLLDPSGRSMGDEADGSSGGGKGTDQAAPSDRMEWDTLYSRNGPGTYRLIMTWNGHRLERDIQVR